MRAPLIPRNHRNVSDRDIRCDRISLLRVLSSKWALLSACLVRWALNPPGITTLLQVQTTGSKNKLRLNLTLQNPIRFLEPPTRCRWLGCSCSVLFVTHSEQAYIRTAHLLGFRLGRFGRGKKCARHRMFSHTHRSLPLILALQFVR